MEKKGTLAGCASESGRRVGARTRPGTSTIHVKSGGDAGHENRAAAAAVEDCGSERLRMADHRVVFEYLIVAVASSTPAFIDFVRGIRKAHSS